MIHNITTTRSHINSVQRPYDGKLAGNDSNNNEFTELKKALKSSKRIIVIIHL